MEKRYFKIEERQVDQTEDSIKFQGLAAVFNQLSEGLHGFKERIKPGAFSKTIKEADVRFLVNHDENLLLARTKNDTLHLTEVEKGLEVRAEFAPTSYAKDVATLVKRGDMNQMSFGFEVKKDVWNTEEDIKIRELQEVKLWDVSVVTFPAYPQTSAEVRAVTPFLDLPLADRGRAWDASAAEGRIRAWASEGDEVNWIKYGRTFLWFDATDREKLQSYKLPYADIINGQLQAVPRGIFAVAAVLMGARGGADIPQSDVDKVKSVVGRYYAKMRKEFDDDSIIPPWEKERSLSIVKNTIDDFDLAELRSLKKLATSSIVKRQPVLSRHANLILELKRKAV